MPAHDAQQADLFDHGRAARVRRTKPRVDREAFASAMVKHKGNRTKAAKEVGFSARTAYSQGSRLMRNPGVRRMVAAKAKELVEVLDNSLERMLEALTRGALCDVRALYAADGSLLPMDKWPAGVADVVAGIETEIVGRGRNRRTVVSKVKFVDKLKCQELIGRHRKMFTDLTENTTRVTLEELVAGE